MKTLALIIALTICGAVIAADEISSAPTNAPRAMLIQAVPTSPTNVCLDGGSTARDCWFSYICFANTTGSAITVTATNASGTAIDLTTAASIAANTSPCQLYPGGMYFKGGLVLSASGAGLNIRGRYARAIN